MKTRILLLRTALLAGLLATACVEKPDDPGRTLKTVNLNFSATLTASGEQIDWFAGENLSLYNGNEGTENKG